MICDSGFLGPPCRIWLVSGTHTYVCYFLLPFYRIQERALGACALEKQCKKRDKNMVNVYIGQIILKLNSNRLFQATRPTEKEKQTDRNTEIHSETQRN